jgi:hypothetical protein
VPELPKNALKALSKRENGPKRIFVMIMDHDGRTRRLSLSLGFFWLTGILAALVLSALGLFIHFFVTQNLENKNLIAINHYLELAKERKDYQKAVEVSEVEAQTILENLDMAVKMAESNANETILTGVPDNSPDDSAESKSSPSDSPQTPVSSDANFINEFPSEKAAWDAWHARLTPITGKEQVDADQFKLSVDGQLSYVLRQKSDPGQRVKGRSVVILAASDPKGRISLHSMPEIDLSYPQSGWELGAKFNIVASKIMSGPLVLPDDLKIVSAEVLTWDEDSKELNYRKKIKIEGR